MDMKTLPAVTLDGRNMYKHNLNFACSSMHACDKSVSSSQRDENTVENQIVKLRSVVQLCNLEAVGFQWMVAKIVYQVVESVPSLLRVNSRTKSYPFW